MGDHHASNSCSVYLNFGEIIKETKAYRLYSKLSLIAEVGGYVGLFLGVSINQISYLMEFMVLKIEHLFSKKLIIK